MNPSVNKGMPTLVAAIGGGAIEALTAGNGYWLETIWLAAVLVAASWPKSGGSTVSAAVHRLPIGKARS